MCTISYTPSMIAVDLDVEVATVYSWIHSGKLDAYKNFWSKKGEWSISKPDYEKFLKAYPKYIVWCMQRIKKKNDEEEMYRKTIFFNTRDHRWLSRDEYTYLSLYTTIDILNRGKLCLNNTVYNVVTFDYSYTALKGELQ